MNTMTSWNGNMRLNKRLSKQSRRWWFETPSNSLWRHCNDDSDAGSRRLCMDATKITEVESNIKSVIWLQYYITELTYHLKILTTTESNLSLIWTMQKKFLVAKATWKRRGKINSWCRVNGRGCQSKDVTMMDKGRIYLKHSLTKHN